MKLKLYADQAGASTLLLLVVVSPASRRADAEEKKLADARVHLQQAFARRANAIPGEKMPDPTKDDSFLPYRNNKDFWVFLSSLQANK